MIFFTSDLHIGHANVIRYCNRPFKDIHHMSEVFIANWNSKVKKEDTVYILGDVFFCKPQEALEFLAKLNGRKILIFGNHDKVIKRSKELFNAFDEILPDLCEINIDGTNIVMSHFPLVSWNRARYGAWMLHGHMHSTLPFTGQNRRYDVGVDANNYAPISFEELKVKMDAVKPIEPSY